MNAKIVSVDLAEAHLLVNYSDGSAALFDGEFLYAHRNDSGNQQMPAEYVDDAQVSMSIDS